MIFHLGNFKRTKLDNVFQYIDGDEIKYFDPELSYEITGYRPINMTEGLDFNPDDFTEAARTFEEKGEYTEFPYGCKP